MSSEAALHHRSLSTIVLCLSRRLLSVNRFLTPYSVTRQKVSQLSILVFDPNVIPVGKKRIFDIIYAKVASISG